MINVSSATKAAWMSDRKVNHLVVSFPDLNLTYENDSIAPDSLSWTEALCNADSMEFVGCIASSFGASIYNIPDNVKGQYIEVTFQAGNTDIIPIFKGYVDSVEIESDSLFKKIKAYDALYNAGQVDVASWYARLPLPMTLGDIRASLMDYVGLTEVEDTELPNDDVMIYRTLENPDTIKGLTVIKSICQLNGACGIINREGLFEYRYVKESMESSYQLLYHESLKYEEFYCNPIQRVQIRDMEDDAGVVTSGTGNKYIVQANMFAYELATDVLYSIANNILEKINGFTYHPMRSIQNGLPFFEVGDTLECVVDPEGYGVDTFLILSRTLTGVQFCRDTFEARGTQNQSEYITDIQAQVNVLKRTTNELRNLSTKIVDYILPSKIEESNIASGSNSNILEFEFYSGNDDEKSSFYSSVNFTIATDADLQTETYGDCTLTVTYIKDGTNVEVQTHTFGDGSYMLMMNYLLNNMAKGNHTFKVKFTLSGGSLSSLQVISAYLLAATVVQEGEYSDDYEIDVDEEFAEYMIEQDQEVVGDFLELSAPTGGSGDGTNFSGNKFCDDWLAAFVRPTEYAEIYVAKRGWANQFIDPSGDEEIWADYTVINTTTLLPEAIDDLVNQNTGKHANMWFANISPTDPSGINTQDYYQICGIYLPPSGVLWKCKGNYPRYGYSEFSLNPSDSSGDWYLPNFGYNYNNSNRGYRRNGTWGSMQNTSFRPYYLVYNVDAFKAYLESLDADRIWAIISAGYFVLADCNVKKEWHKKGVTDWSDNDDYHNENQ